MNGLSLARALFGRCSHNLDRFIQRIPAPIEAVVDRGGGGINEMLHTGSGGHVRDEYRRESILLQDLPAGLLGVIQSHQDAGILAAYQALEQKGIGDIPLHNLELGYL